MQGYLDNVTLRSIRGWAADQQGQPVNLVASVNNIELASFRTSFLRPDLHDFLRKDLGFEIDLGRELEIGDVVSVTTTQNEHLAGSPHRVTGKNATREQKALCLIRRGMKILEIGPSFRPLAPKSAGWNTFSLDHATQDELRLKYPEHAVDKIEPVDYLWKGGLIETAIPQSEYGSFDAVIASHVIEHIPDPIGFFESAGILLKEQGLLSLVIPDKRLTFDFFKPISTTGDFMQARHQSRSRHTKKTAFENIAYNVSERGEIGWSARLTGSFALVHTGIDEAKQAFDDAVENLSGPYLDYHGTIYTPSSFALIALELGQLGIIPFAIERSFPTNHCEFYVTLRKGSPEKSGIEQLNQQRLRLMKQVTRELGQQAKWLLDEDDSL